MKTVILFLIVFALGYYFYMNNENKKEIPKPMLVSVVYDLSLTTDKYYELKEEDLKKLYIKISKQGGGVIYGMKILTNSYKQEILKWNVPSLQLKKETGNFLIDPEIKNENEVLKKKNDSLATEFVSAWKKMFLHPHKNRFTDIEGVLTLLKSLYNDKTYQAYNKKIIMISDCINDLPPVDGEDKIENSYYFPNCEIIMVRPKKDYFISNPVRKALTISGAMDML